MNIIKKFPKIKIKFDENRLHDLVDDDLKIIGKNQLREEKGFKSSKLGH